VTLSGKVSQLQHPPPPLFVPVKAVVTPSAGQNKPLPGEDGEAAKAVDSIQTTPVNQFSTAAKGTESDTQYYTLEANRSFCFKDFQTDSFLPPKNRKPKYFLV